MVFFLVAPLLAFETKNENVQLAQSNEIRLKILDKIQSCDTHLYQSSFLTVWGIQNCFNYNDLFKKTQRMEGYKLDPNEVEVNIHILYAAKAWHNDNLVCQVYLNCTVLLKKFYNSQLYHILNV